MAADNNLTSRKTSIVFLEVLTWEATGFKNTAEEISFFKAVKNTAGKTQTNASIVKSSLMVNYSLSPTFLPFSFSTRVDLIYMFW